MAQQWPFQEEKSEWPMSDGVHRFTYPGHSLQPTNASLAWTYPDALPVSDYRNTNLMVEHQECSSGPSIYSYPSLYSSKTLPYASSSQYKTGRFLNPYSAAATTNPTYNQFSRSLSTSNSNDMFIDPHLFSHANSDTPKYEISNPPTNDSTTPLQVNKPCSGPRRKTLLKRVPKPQELSSPDEIGDNGIAALYGYDPLWVQHTGADPSSVLDFGSKMKFGVIFTEGVIQRGDRLTIEYSSAFSAVSSQGTAVLTHTGFSKLNKPGRQQYYPDLALTLTSHPAYTRTLLACTGMQDIQRVFQECQISGADVNGFLARGLHVWRGNLELGTFGYVRQAYHAWKMRMDAEAERTGTLWRARRGDTSKIVAVEVKKGGKPVKRKPAKRKTAKRNAAKRVPDEKV